MYREGFVYDEICKTVIDVYIDYDIRKFPVDEKEVCRKLGVALIPYSAFTSSDRKVLMKKSNLGFFVKATSTTSPMIFYNDVNKTEGEIRFTIFHELKHYVFEDLDDSEDDLADYFSRYFMCPIPYMLLKKIDSASAIMAYCNISYAAAQNAQKNLVKRRNRTGYTIWDYEKRLINHLDSSLAEAYKL